MSPSTMAIDLSQERLASVIGDGCENNLSFFDGFYTDNGEKCTACSFCNDGSKKSSLLNPAVSSTCIDCTTATCTRYKFTANFQTAWTMTFFKLYSSSKSSATDPHKVIIEASNSSSGESTTLFDSEQSGVNFVNREAEYSYMFPNENEYRYYSIIFVRKASSSQMTIGHYGLIEAYTSDCTAKKMTSLLGVEVLPIATTTSKNTPTNTPTAKLTTNTPTLFLFDPYSNLVTYTDHGSCGPRGDDAQADLAQCEFGYRVVKKAPFRNWSYVSFINGCGYYEVTVYECVTNLALQGTATQSSFYSSLNPASKAIDNDTTSHTHTLLEPYPWWRVQLKSLSVIRKVKIWNRVDCCTDRLSNSEVRILDSSGNVVAKQTIGNAAGIYTFEFNFNDVTGSAVMVQIMRKEYLHLAQVQVLGYI